MQNQLAEYLSQFVSPHKLALFDQMLLKRTRHLTVVLEDIFGSHNASACLRSCECFGIQDVHVVENKNPFQISRDVALGAAQWLTLNRYKANADNTQVCLTSLKQKGYKVIATVPSHYGCPLDEYDVRQKTALVFGTEMNGLSDDALKRADGFLRIPMFGFTESLNISVAVAVCLQHLIQELRKSSVCWQINCEERDELQAEWIKRVVKKKWEPLENEFWKRRSQSATESTGNVTAPVDRTRGTLKCG